MSTVDHVEALKAKHASLEHAISEETARPHPNDDALSPQKNKKLHITLDIPRLTPTPH